MFEMVLLGSFLWRPFLDPVEGVVKPVIEVCKLAAIGASVFMTNPVQIMFLANLIGPVRGPSPPPPTMSACNDVGQRAACRSLSLSSAP